MLIDLFLPVYEWKEVHSIDVAAPPAAVLQAVRRVTPEEIRLLRVLFTLRALPGRLLGGRPRLRPRGPVLEGILRSGFTVLGEEPGHELVVGTIGRFWQARPQHADVSGGEAFRAFAEEGWARAAMNFSVSPAGAGTRLQTETRIAATDTSARRRFGAYWLFVRPGSALIRLMWLRAVKRRAERDVL